MIDFSHSPPGGIFHTSFYGVFILFTINALSPLTPSLRFFSRTATPNQVAWELLVPLSSGSVLPEVALNFGHYGLHNGRNKMSFLCRMSGRLS